MNCQGKICNKAIFSSGVTVDGTGNVLINIPAREGGYGNLCNYCLFITQNIPTTAAIGAPVFITIGAAATLYPLNNCNGTQVVASNLSSRRRYCVKVVTTATTGSFKLLGNIGCSPVVNLSSLPAPTT